MAEDLIIRVHVGEPAYNVRGTVERRAREIFEDLADGGIACHVTVEQADGVLTEMRTAKPEGRLG